MAPSDQRLISKQDYDDFFAPSWLAANGRLKVFQRHDIYAVDVPGTCEKLLSLVTTPQSRSALDSSSSALEDDAEEENMNVAPKRQMPFRVASSLCYGTLRIYKLQVDRLLNMSRDLCARSKCELKVAIATATKRRSSYSTESAVATKKRRYAKKAIQKESCINNFSKMMSEAQELVKWSANFDENDIENYEISNEPGTQQRIQMREITIRETNVDMVLSRNDDHELDDFGLADYTHSLELVDHFQEYFSQSTVQMKSLKRKATEQIYNNNKLPRNCSADSGFSPDASIEVPRCASASMNDCISPNNCFEPCSSALIRQQNCVNDLERNASTQINEFIGDSHIDEFNTWRNADTSNVRPLNEQHCNDFQLATVSEEMNSLDSPPEKVDLQPPMQKKIRIDKCTELPSKKILAQIESSAKWKIDVRKQLEQQKTLPKPHELFVNLNRNLKVNSVFKKKPKISQDVAEREYLSILSEIFSDQPQTSIADLAAEIHPIEKLTNSRKRKLPTEAVVETEHNLLNELEQYASFGVTNTNVDINQNSEMQLLQAETNTTATGDAACIAAADDYDDDAKWRPYGVMMQLLNIWRSAATNEDGIMAKRFCLSADIRLHAAMAFGSLLVLAANKFITLKKAANSIEMETIELGVESYKLIATSTAKA